MLQKKKQIEKMNKADQRERTKVTKMVVEEKNIERKKNCPSEQKKKIICPKEGRKKITINTEEKNSI